MKARRGGIKPGQGGAEGTDACEMVEVTFVEEGHEVESDVAEETISALVKLAKEICESCDIGQPAAECQLMVLPSKRKLAIQSCELRPSQGGAEDTEERVLTRVFPCPFWKAMFSSTSRPADCEGWFMVRSRPPREAGFDPLEESRRHRGVCLDVAEYGVGSAVETTSAMVMLAFELSLACGAPLPRDDEKLARGRLKSRRLVLQVTAWCPTSQKAPRSVWPSRSTLITWRAGRSRRKRGVSWCFACLGAAELGVRSVLGTTTSAVVKLALELGLGFGPSLPKRRCQPL